MRRKNLLVTAYLAMGAAVALTSCSNDDVLNDNVIDAPVEAGTQEIVLQVSNGGDGLTTRAGRDLVSSEAKQEIDEVKVLICNSAKTKNVVYATTIDNWMTTSKEYTENGHGREIVHTILDDAKLSAGKYTVYAIGYSNNSDYSNLETGVKKIQKEGTFNENLALTLNSGAQPEEIFAGSLELTVESGKGFREPVVLNRQVAGAFAYVKDIPVIEGATKIQLVASSKNTSLVLGHFANVNLTGNGMGNGTNVKYVINGTETEASTPHIICEIKLSDWFVNTSLDANKDGIIDGETNWKSNNNKEGEVEFANGSAFAGQFVIPFAKSTSSEQTFELRMVNDSGSELRSWTVSLPSNDGQLSSHTLSTWNGTESEFKDDTNTDTQGIFNVVRNHLYTIGKRSLDDPENPGTDPDEPESLATKQELTLQVCDNWEVIHQMGIE